MDADDRKSEGVHWYHWMGLSACSAGMLMIGILEVMQGADPTSRFFAIDNVAVRMLGVAMVICALWLPLRHDKAFLASVWVLGLTIAENLVTYRFESFALADTATVLATLAIMLVLPAFILIELRKTFREDAGRGD